jgi:hypothetical protein
VTANGPGDDPGTAADAPVPGSDGTDDATAPVRLEPTRAGSRVARRRTVLRPVPGRTAALVTVAAVLLGVGAISALAPPPAPAAAPSAGDGAMVAPVAAHASSFFCATGVGTDAGAGATATIVLTNTTAAAVTGVETAVSTAGGNPVRTPVVVPAHGTGVVDPTRGLPAGGSAATFAFAAGGVTGTSVVSGPRGWSTAPCVTQVSPQWDFAGGSTSTGLLDLSLYNPTAAPAVVDVTFLTASGTVLDPQAYQGVSVGPGQVVVETLGAYVQDQSVVATLVQATSGALVASELDQMVVPGGSGLALLTGTPGPAATWRFAQTMAVPGGSVTLAIANPGTSPVTATVTAGLSGASVLPHQVAVPPRTVVPYAVSAVAGWPLGTAYALTVAATGPVVVGRTVVAPPGGTAPRAGIACGTTATATGWLVVGPGEPGLPAVPGGTIASVAVANPGRSAVTVTIRQLHSGATLVTSQVAAGGLAVFPAKQVGRLDPLVVSASAPVSVEMDGYPAGAPGVVSSTGLVLAG